MKLEIDMPEHHYNNIMALDSVSLGRVPYKGIIMYTINAIKHGKILEQEPKTGHWKLVQRGKFIDVCCSNCEAVRIKEYAYNYTIDQLDKEDLKECFECADMRYCPNCGAKMVESQESEDKE